MERFSAEVIDKTVCDDIVTMRLAKPGGWQYRAGQWFTLTLQTSEGPQTKTFSHASAPSDPTIDLATRLSGSAFKNALDGLEEGAPVQIGGPGGRLKVEDAATHVVFLTGGVGVTPARSIVRDRIARRIPFDDALLLYGNRGPECVPYLDEFTSEQAREHGVRVELVYEHALDDWAGERGFITAGIVRRHLTDLGAVTFLVSGPPPMVVAMQSVLDELGIPADRRLVESFGR